MTERERAAKLVELERRNAEAMIAVVLNGRRASEVIALQLAVESISCAVMSVHRARTNASSLPKKLRRRVERSHTMLVNLALEVGDELSRAITRPK